MKLWWQNHAILGENKTSLLCIANDHDVANILTKHSKDSFSWLCSKMCHIGWKLRAHLLFQKIHQKTKSNLSLTSQLHVSNCFKNACDLCGNVSVVVPLPSQKLACTAFRYSTSHTHLMQVHRFVLGTSFQIDVLRQTLRDSQLAAISKGDKTARPLRVSLLICSGE